MRENIVPQVLLLIFELSIGLLCNFFCRGLFVELGPKSKTTRLSQPLIGYSDRKYLRTHCFHQPRANFREHGNTIVSCAKNPVVSVDQKIVELLFNITFSTCLTKEDSQSWNFCVYVCVWWLGLPFCAANGACTLKHVCHDNEEVFNYGLLNSQRPLAVM